jgi:predicted O-methyltransferase YrrM
MPNFPAQQTNYGLSPLIITGMHRSGTSLTASFLQTLGVNVGDRLYAADRANQKGYFEDVDFLEFQRQVLQASCNPNEPGWPDWGWTESEQLHKHNFANYIQPAQALIATRANSQTLWGWKDPRTSLMLDFWHDLLPQARYLLVYRFPWDVADSILRLNEPIFQAHPDYAIRAWHFYNRQLLDFYTQHRDACLLVSVNGFLKDPSRLVELVQKRFSLSLNPGYRLDAQNSENAIADIYDEKLFGSLDWEHPLVKLVPQIAPECISLLEELDRVADLPSPFNFKGKEESILASVLQLQQQAITARSELKSRYNTHKSNKDINLDVSMAVSMTEHAQPTSDRGTIERSPELQALLASPPKLHKDRTGNLVSYQACEEVLDFIDLHVTKDSRTLETGTGISTIVFAIRGGEHTCIAPGQGQFDRIQQYCRDRQISTDRINFQCHYSEQVLPQLNTQPLDLVLIDGCHGFPVPFIDWFYAASHLKKDGILIVDDTQLWTGEVLKEYLRSEPEWELVQDIVHRAVIFRKLQATIPTKEWDQQPYIKLAESLSQKQAMMENDISLMKANFSLEEIRMTQEITNLRNEITAMKTSKFWQLREAWFAVKRSLKMSN